MIMKTKAKRTAMISLFLAILISALAFTSLAAAIAKTEGVYVYDEADVIPAEDENDMNSRAKALQALTGSQLITVTVKNLGGVDRVKYATDLFSDWKLSADKNNSVLVLLSIDDADYYVLPGSELTGKMGDNALREVFDASLEPDFAAGKYGDGAKKTFDDLLSRIEKIYSVDVSTWDPNSAPAEPVAEESSGFSIGKFFKWLFIIILILAGIFAVIVAVAFFRRPKYVNNGANKRRHYNTDRGAYVGQDDIERARRREAANRARGTQYPQGQQTRGQRPQGQGPQGQQVRGQYPQGQRPQGQQVRGQYPQGQRPQGQQVRGQYPQGQRPQGQQVRGQYPQGQRPQGQYPQGQQVRRPGQQDPQYARRPDAPVSHEHPTAYPERAPYVNMDDQNGSANGAV